jgi:hypothetical protein
MLPLINKKAVLKSAGVDKRVGIKNIRNQGQNQDLAKVVEIKR